MSNPPDAAEINELLRSYTMVTVGSNVRIARWVPRALVDADQAYELQLIRPEAFTATFAGRYYTIESDDDGGRKLPLAKLLLSRMRKYDGLTFMPGGEAVILNKMNLWRGFGVAATEGKWPLMEEHVRDVVASGNDSHAHYILNWLAWCVQHPDERAGVALVIRGRKGTGKGTLGNAMCRIFGTHGVHISNRKHLISGFNRHLMHCCFLFADEAYWPGERSAEGELKRIITEPTLFIEPKGLDGFQVRNCLHMMITGNDGWLFPASADERRAAVFDIEDERPRPRSYFDALYTELNAGGIEAMLFDLLSEPLGSWHPRDDIPKTEALLRQKEESLHGIDALVADLASVGRLPYPIGGKANVCSSSGEAEGTGLWAYAKKTVPELRYKIARLIMMRLRKDWGCSSWHVGNERGVEFPPLAELRQAYAARYGSCEWDSPGAEWGA